MEATTLEATTLTIQVTGRDSTGAIKNPNQRYSIYGYCPTFSELYDEHAKKVAPASLWEILVELRKHIHDNSGDSPEVGVVNSNRQFLDTGSCVIANTHYGRKWHSTDWGVNSEWVLGVGLGQGGRPGRISIGAAARLAPALTRHEGKRLGVKVVAIEKPEEEAARLEKEAAERNERYRKADALAHEEAVKKSAQDKEARRNQAVEWIAKTLNLDNPTTQNLLNEISIAIC